MVAEYYRPSFYSRARKLSIENSVDKYFQFSSYVAVWRTGSGVLLPVYEDTAPLFIIFILIASYSIQPRRKIVSYI